MKTHNGAIHNRSDCRTRSIAGHSPVPLRSAFTLVELLVTISIIAIMATFVMFASYSAMESAKEAKTKAVVTKLNNMVMAKYEGYRTRRVAVASPSGTALQLVAKQRLDSLRELMRLELPDRWSDITTDPISGIARPAISQAYLRRYNQLTNNGSNVPQNLGLFQGAECLYMIVTLGLTDELGGRDHFSDSSIGDVDGDGFPEFLDAWKNPIRFLRWAPGFPSELQYGGTTSSVTSAASATEVNGDAGLSIENGAYNGRAIIFTAGSLKGQAAQVMQYEGSGKKFTLFADQLSGAPSVGDSTFVVAPDDPFDPRHVYPALQPTPANGKKCPTFALYPLIYSAGPDEIFDIVSDTDTQVVYGSSGVNNNPFVGYRDSGFASGQIGSIADLKSTDRNGIESQSNSINNAADNIHNHLMETRVNR